MIEPKGENLSEQDKLIIRELGGDLGDGARPFQDLGLRIGLSEDEVLETIQSLRDRGYLRRFGATLRHQVSGFTANAMVAWRVDEDKVDEIGPVMASFKGVTHCYHRPGTPGWRYNIYTMIHGLSKQECYDQAKQMSDASGITEYELLFSYEELKKTSMRYFT